MNLPPGALSMLVAAVLIGAVGSFVHQRAYKALYRKLTARGLVGQEYRPDWTALIGAGACMGYITRMRREIGEQNLQPDERALLQRAVLSYYASVPLVFILTCALFWRLYQD